MCNRSRPDSSGPKVVLRTVCFQSNDQPCESGKPRGRTRNGAGACGLTGGSASGGGWRRLRGGRGGDRGEARNPAGEALKAITGHHHSDLIPKQWGPPRNRDWNKTMLTIERGISNFALSSL